MAEECEDNKLNLSPSKCNNLPVAIKSMIETNDNFFLDEADYADEAALLEALQDAIKAGRASRIYLWPTFVGVEDNSKAVAYEDTNLAYLEADNGQYRYRLMISKSICMHKATFSHKRSDGRVFLIDKKNQLFGTKGVDGKFKGFKLQLLNPENLMIGVDGSVATKSPIQIALDDTGEINENGYTVKAGSVISSLVPLADVTLTLVGSVSATTIVVDVKASCDGTPITGLVVADFALTETDGDPQTITSAVESTTVEGRYTLTGTAFVDGFLNLDPPAILSIDAYEAQNTLTINVP